MKLLMKLAMEKRVPDASKKSTCAHTGLLSAVIALLIVETDRISICMASSLEDNLQHVKTNCL